MECEDTKFSTRTGLVEGNNTHARGLSRKMFNWKYAKEGCTSAKKLLAALIIIAFIQTTKSLRW